jgi:hypothetical protein
MTPSMTFSSKVLSSSSSSPARAAPEAINRPTPRATAESRKACLTARDEPETTNLPASAFRMA